MFDGVKFKSDSTPIKPDMINKTQTKVMIEIGLEVKTLGFLKEKECKREEFGSDAVDCESDGKEEERDYHVNKMYEEERDDGGYCHRGPPGTVKKQKNLIVLLDQVIRCLDITMPDNEYDRRPTNRNKEVGLNEDQSQRVVVIRGNLLVRGLS
ncbi:hypothetical protein PPACK8108_LOCUS20106 [Phakopsora pachyrhizi]|uniref:Uncharacterized protein n=1 Tax=Phakopsora pachyrhizi TaxID=170000 RepID=A0AAV0BE75_PHAPC|nr:hypothetical protein PPACK8108_LOCUS20106 [Phakopsora pachyrhizi]